jgi:formylmethanofuran dehydrogenase subunit E
MNKKLWDECVKFHGHECPGLAIGFRAAEIADEKIGIRHLEDEDAVCITENEACGVDAVQYMTGCTLGKGNLIYRDTGKMAFSFFNRKTGESIRLVLKRSEKDNQMTREERQNHILEGPLEEVYDIKKVHYEIPEKAKIFNTVICDKCKEGAPEHKIRLSDGKKMCLDCFNEYSRGW